MKNKRHPQKNPIVMIHQCNAHSLDVNEAQRAQEKDRTKSELYTFFVLYMLVLQLLQYTL